MGDTVVLVDTDGRFYAFDAAALDEPAAVTADQIEEARLTDAAQAAAAMAFGYERVGQACGPGGPGGPGAGEVVLAGRRFSLLGRIGAR